MGRRLRIFNYKDVELDGRLRWLINGPHFDMRLVEIEPSSDTKRPHTHPWEHEVFIVDGQGTIFDGCEMKAFGEGDVLYIPADEPHAFINVGDTTLRFVCCIPAGVELDQITPIQ